MSQLHDKNLVKKILTKRKVKKQILCKNCDNRASTFQPFCNKECRSEYFAYIQVNVPVPFIKKIYNHCDEMQRAIEIKKFAKYHSVNYKHVERKICETFDKNLISKCYL